MKRLVMLAVLLAALLSAGAAMAGGAQEAVLASHPDGEIVLEDNTDEDFGVYACIVRDNSRYFLCAATARDGGWTLICDTSDALLQTLPTCVSMDTDGETLWWTYADYQGQHLAYSARYTPADGWDTVSLIRSRNEARSEGALALHPVVLTSYSNGYVFREMTWEDEDGNLHGERVRYIPVPCPNREDWVLTSFTAEDNEWLPIYEEYDSWPGRENLRAAASVLFPGEAFLGGSLPGSGSEDGQYATLRFLMRGVDGTIRLRCVREERSYFYTGPSYEIASSTPLPEGTIYGVENFTDSLGIPGATPSMVSVGWYGGGWGVSELGTPTGFLRLGSHWVRDDGMPARTAYGAHPWADIGSMNWLSLPGSWDEAVQAMDLRDYAVVCNPNPGDRLHLREQPDKGARSMGKFYNGTPVRVLKRQGDWVQVQIGVGSVHLTGWMMKKYLVTGTEATRVEARFPTLYVKDELEYFGLSDSWQPNQGKNLRTLPSGTPFTVVGVMEGKWHIVLLEDGDCGYVHIDSLTEGNG